MLETNQKYASRVWGQK